MVIDLLPPPSLSAPPWEVDANRDGHGHVPSVPEASLAAQKRPRSAPDVPAVLQGVAEAPPRHLGASKIDFSLTWALLFAKNTVFPDFMLFAQSDFSVVSLI